MILAPTLGFEPRVSYLEDRRVIRCPMWGYYGIGNPLYLAIESTMTGESMITQNTNPIIHQPQPIPKQVILLFVLIVDFLIRLGDLLYICIITQCPLLCQWALYVLPRDVLSSDIFQSTPPARGATSYL